MSNFFSAIGDAIGDVSDWLFAGDKDKLVDAGVDAFKAFASGTKDKGDGLLGSRDSANPASRARTGSNLGVRASQSKQADIYGIERRNSSIFTGTEQGDQWMTTFRNLIKSEGSI